MVDVGLNASCRLFLPILFAGSMLDSTSFLISKTPIEHWQGYIVLSRGTIRRGEYASMTMPSCHFCKSCDNQHAVFSCEGLVRCSHIYWWPDLLTEPARWDSWISPLTSESIDGLWLDMLGVLDIEFLRDRGCGVASMSIWAIFLFLLVILIVQSSKLLSWIRLSIYISQDSKTTALSIKLLKTTLCLLSQAWQQSKVSSLGVV